jgi:hypothetical protein
VKQTAVKTIREMIASNSYILNLDTHMCFAIRVIAKEKSDENQSLLTSLYSRNASPIVRRDIILTLGRWREWYWLSDLRNHYRNLSGSERRAFIAASFTLRDEGEHWRRHAKAEFNPFEKFIQVWIAGKADSTDWTVPL